MKAYRLGLFLSDLVWVDGGKLLRNVCTGLIMILIEMIANERRTNRKLSPVIPVQPR